MRNKNNSVKRIAITQILLLVIGFLAITWMIGSEVEFVSGNGDESVEGTETNEATETTTPEESSKFDGGDLVDTLSKSITIAEAGKKGLNIFKSPAKTGLITNPNNIVPQVVGPGSAGPEVVVTKDISILLGGGSAGGAIIAIAGWSAVAFVLGRYVIGPAFGLNVQQSQGLGKSLGAGTAATLALTQFTALGFSSFALGAATLGIGLAVAFIVSVFAIKNSSIDVIKYSCYSWDAEIGGKNCDLCEKQDVECTEYQCSSLGQGCEFSIDEISGQPSCRWENSKDLKAPIIKPRIDSLFNTNEYVYTPDNQLSPPSTGVRVQYDLSQDGCAPPWTPVSFGIELIDPETNEPEKARCKISPGEVFRGYAQMPDLFMSEGLRAYNHTFQLSLPPIKSSEAEGVFIENGGIYDFYVRCVDSNGNANAAAFAFKFCIQEGPDKRPPEIVKTYPLNNSYFASGETNYPMSIYVNEPSDCKWSISDKNYDSMENNFNCVKTISQASEGNLFRCSGILDGLKDNQNNDFYFRCKDQPGENESLRNVNSNSYHYRIIGTQRLAIKSVSPNNTVIKDSTSRINVDIEVETILGANDGKAVCSLSETGIDGSFASFYYGQGVELFSQHIHKQTLTLPEGDYTYYVRCTDIGGNSDTTSINFKVETDTEPPIVVRVFRDRNNLKIITNEQASCVYSSYSESYEFKEGIKMSTLSGGLDTEHYASWPENSKTTYYIKCEDQYGKRPPSAEATIIVRPFDIPGVRE